eukprot:9248711-Lingulodinium_polyedra.AAC.1
MRPSVGAGRCAAAGRQLAAPSCRDSGSCSGGLWATREARTAAGTGLPGYSNARARAQCGVAGGPACSSAHRSSSACWLPRRRWPGGWSPRAGRPRR